MVTEDVEEMKEMLSFISAEIPKLLTALTESLFGGEQTSRYAEAVSDFYKSLREAGMSETEAFELTKAFMDKTNLAALIQNLIGTKRDPGAKMEREIGTSIEESIKEKIKRKFEEKGTKSDEE